MSNKSNLTNANSKFQNFGECDYQKHWSYSILIKNLFICQALLEHNRVIEIGAADSRIKEMLSINFNHQPQYIKYDYNSMYEGIIKLDVTKGIPQRNGSQDAIVFSEVLEHLPRDKVGYVMAEINRVLMMKGSLLLTTPTPLSEGELVWPDVHDQEYTRDEVLSIVKMAGFRVLHEMPWHIRGNLDIDILNSGLPLGFRRAVLSTLVGPGRATQIALHLIKMENVT